MAGPQISPKESDVVCFQETCMSSHESKVFGNAMWKRGWVTYFLPFGQNRGVLTLVRKGLCSQIAFKHDVPGGQCLAVSVGHVQVLNVYAAHHDARNEFLTEVFQSVQTLGHNSWVLLGGLNSAHRFSFGPWLGGFRMYNLCAASRGGKPVGWSQGH